MQRRSTVAVTGTLVLALGLAACSSGGGSGSEGTGGDDATDFSGETLTVWIMEGTNPDADAFFDEVTTAFKDETGADLQIEFQPWASAHDKFTTAIAGGTTDLPGIVILCPSTDALPAAEEGEDDLADSTLLTVPPRRAAASDTPGVPDRERELMDLIEFLRLDPASFASPRDRRVSFAASTASRDSGKRVLHKRRHASMPVDGASQSRPSTKSVTSFWASFRRRNGAMPDLRYSWS